MPYLLIICLAIFSLFIIVLINTPTEKEELCKSRISNATHTVISDGGKYALVMYNHDPHDEAQLSWALANAKGLNGINNRNIFFYNISSKRLSKRIINDTYTKIKEEDYKMLNGYPNENEVSYMFIVKHNEENIIFNTIIKY